MRHVPRISAAMLAAVFLWGCSQKSPEDKTAETPAPVQTPALKGDVAAAPKVASIAQLLNQPKAYAGKDVAVKGVFSGICCESDFFLKDGVDTIEVYATPMCPMPSKSKVLSKLTVIGTVMVRNDQPALTAKELRFE